MGTNAHHMTRYAITRASGNYGLEYVAACYEPIGSGVVYTPLKTDACTYVTFEKAAQIAKHLQQTVFGEFMLALIED
jgi:hypothetical protein